jgi:hypothetical protein
VGTQVDEVKEQSRPTPAWLRVVAAIGIAAFLILFVAGVLGYYDWWLVASIVFVFSFGAVWFHKLRGDREEPPSP